MRTSTQNSNLRSGPINSAGERRQKDSASARRLRPSSGAPFVSNSKRSYRRRAPSSFGDPRPALRTPRQTAQLVGCRLSSNVLRLCVARTKTPPLCARRFETAPIHRKKIKHY